MHAIICGVTESGKTTLARALSRRMCAEKQNVIVYDPVGTATYGGEWGKSAVVFNDPQKFWGYISRDDVHHAHVFIDEAGDIFHLGARENFWLLTRGRHFGFQVYLISQRPKMIAPSARAQCGVAYMFRLAKDDAKEICADFGHDWPFRDAESKQKITVKELDKGDFYTLYSGAIGKNRSNIFQILKPTSRKEKKP